MSGGWVWLACQHPERPPVLGETEVHAPGNECRPCFVAFQAAWRNGTPFGQFFPEYERRYGNEPALRYE